MDTQAEIWMNQNAQDTLLANTLPALFSLQAPSVYLSISAAKFQTSLVTPHP